MKLSGPIPQNVLQLMTKKFSIFRTQVFHLIVDVPAII